MQHSTRHSGWLAGLTVLVAALVIPATMVRSAAEPAQDKAVPKPLADGPQKRAEAMGIKFEKLKPGYLNGCVRSGNLLFTSGFGSKMKGRLGKDLTAKEGYQAARECAVEILRAVWDRHGTLDGLRVVKVLGCVNSSPDFTDQPEVINGCSDMFHEIFGKQTDGYHARSALGFASLPRGFAVEIEAIFEIKGSRE